MQKAILLLTETTVEKKADIHIVYWLSFIIYEKENRSKYTL